MNKKIIVSVVMLLMTIGMLGGYVIAASSQAILDRDNKIDSFEKCVAAGFPIQETAPLRCMDGNGRTFIEGDGQGYKQSGQDSDKAPIAPSDLYAYSIKSRTGNVYSFDSDMPIKNVEADRITVQRDDGAEGDVAIFPEDALNRAFDYQEGDVEINLEERQLDDTQRVVYNINVDSTDGRFLGLFKIKTRYGALVDAQTGDVLEWNGPWWGFLISGEPQRPEVNEAVPSDIINKDETEVSDYDSCVAVTGISTDGIPSECTYEGITYKQEIKSTQED